MDGDVDVLKYRADLADKRADAADARMARIEHLLIEMKAAMVTRVDLTRWGWTLAAFIVASGIGVGAAMLQASNNQISAFQAGLGAIQAVASAQALKPPPPGH